jgi:hypothetical protein
MTSSLHRGRSRAVASQEPGVAAPTAVAPAAVVAATASHERRTSTPPRLRSSHDNETGRQPEGGLTEGGSEEDDGPADGAPAAAAGGPARLWRLKGTLAGRAAADASRAQRQYSVDPPADVVAAGEAAQLAWLSAFAKFSNRHPRR